MRISHRHKFIFFSNPKTGSESVRALLDPYSDISGVPMWKLDGSTPFYSHIRPVEVREEFERVGWDFDAYFKFSFVRNPWSRAVSLYQMIYGHLSAPKRVAARILGGHVSPRGFQHWVRTISTDGPGAGGRPDQGWQRYGTYSARAYFGDGQGRELVDLLIRLENIDRDLPPTLERMGLPRAGELEIPKLNVSKSAPYQDFYDRATADYVRDLYAEDIDRFGYSFDD